MKLRTHLFLAVVLSIAFAAGQAQIVPPVHPASPSVASGQRSEPKANNADSKKNNADSKKEAESGDEAFLQSPSVVKLGGMLGMKPATASSAFQWLNFLVLAAAVLYGMAKMLPKFYRGRSEVIQKNIVEARVATEEARARLSAVEDRLMRLDSDLAALRADSDRGAADDEQRMAAQIEEEKARIVHAAEQEIAAASAAAQRSLRAYAAGIAVDRAAAELNLSKDDDRMLIESFAARAEGSRN